ncbi:hypothetical protein PICMEDRAFT_9926 [Pichia membranifaciens NRRL Y-2026]|uniref:Uncharacterized protein n=1 Tax=Pichia membranifaciens NRRL Y-2026 TaxID=763406 RepID=A0A1E3NTQ1_9ASCO|nr:hypothetical protein PICMEDRAFT_9926 [Pichia membranifaciens NRRL Y-2026]ODQ49462.1 hypothetical protein PICMEDRAFT_9926 [Pichia membranifaciens NRRL Y-2026]
MSLISDAHTKPSPPPPQEPSMSLADPISMTLQPPTVKRGHRHRRSAAISGDFDSNSFLQPPPTSANSSNALNLSKSLPCSPVKSSVISSILGNGSGGTTLHPKESMARLDCTAPTLTPAPTTGFNSSLQNSSYSNSTGNNNSGSTSNYYYASTSNTTTTPTPNSNLSTPIKFYLTDETKFTNSNSNIPDALIDLDDINNNSTFSSSLPNNFNLSLNLNPASKFGKKQFSFHDFEGHTNHLPKHSLLCSPKKTDVMIVEEITEENNTFDLENDADENVYNLENTGKYNNNNSNNNHISNNNNSSGVEEEDEEDDSYDNIIPSSTFSNNQFELNSLLMSKQLNNSLTSLPTKNSNNSSSNSINSNPNPFSTLNTSSISSLKGKVRYQSYYSLAPSTPKNSHHHNFNSIGTTTSNTTTSNGLSSANGNYHRLSNSMSMSPIKPTVKSPFQYQSLQYDLPDGFHQKNNVLEDLENEQLDEDITNDVVGVDHQKAAANPKSIKNTSDSTFLVDNKSKVSLKDMSSSSSTISNKSNVKLNVPPSKSKHERSSSLFSILSKKISHHRRRSSAMSAYSKKSTSIIEQTNDELLGLNINVNNNDSTLNEDFTLTQDCLGEPGPMIEIGENDINQLTENGAKLNRTANKKKMSHSNNHHGSSGNSNSISVSSTSNKKGLFSWIVKSKKNRVSST